MKPFGPTSQMIFNYLLLIHKLYISNYQLNRPCKKHNHLNISFLHFKISSILCRQPTWKIWKPWFGQEFSNTWKNNQENVKSWKWQKSGINVAGVSFNMVSIYFHWKFFITFCVSIDIALHATVKNFYL